MRSGSGIVLARSFYERDSRTVAPELLNKVLRAGRRSGRVVEVEAYAGSDDPASHAYRGPTKRNRVMFGPPGHLYVYFTYGMHWCANAVCGSEGVAHAVLLRALSPLTGLEEMRTARPRARRDRDLCSGPAKLCQSMGLDGSSDGADLVSGDRGVVLVDDGTPPPDRPGRSVRIGISTGNEQLWRWFVEEDPNLSRPDRSR
ncbi:MAG: putative 3-methyladenine DNA glycosylase [Acidimicrobiales bacterium]|nr:putative 3-methyladenine DNA glycosylase [Acidimicrobiales bacterium]